MLKKLVKVLGTPKGRLVAALLLALSSALTLSFCLTPFWLGTSFTKALLFLLSFLATGSIYFFLLKRLEPLPENGCVRQLAFLFPLLAALTVTFGAFGALKSSSLLYNPYQLSLTLRGQSGQSGSLVIDSVRLAAAGQEFRPRSISAACAREGNIFRSQSGRACEITYLVPVFENFEDKLLVQFNTQQSQGSVDIALPGIQQSFSFPSQDSPTLTFSANLRSLRQREVIPLYLLAWFSLFTVFLLLALTLRSLLDWHAPKLRLSGKSADLLATAVFLIIALLAANARFGTSLTSALDLPSDAGNIASYVAAQQHPANFAQDELLSNPANYSEYFAFHLPLIGFLSRLTGSYASAFMALLAPVTFLHLLGYYLLGTRLLGRRTLALAFTVFTALPVSLPLFEFYGLAADVLPRFLFQALLPFALLLLLGLRDKRSLYWLVSLAFTLLLYTHPVSGPAWVGVCLVTLLYFSIRARGRCWWQSFLPAVLVFLLGVIPFLRAYFGANTGIILDPALLQAVNLDRYASQTLSLWQFYTSEFPAFLAAQWPLLTLTLLFSGLAALGVFRLIRSKGRALDEEQVLLGLWWLVLLAVAILIPLLDEAYARLSGGGLMLREIRRTLRYFVPMLWLTFLWVCKRALNLFDKTRSAGRLRAAVFVSVAVMLLGYGISTQVWTNPLLQRQWECLRAGSLICRPTPEAAAKQEFYTELARLVAPGESVFPDPSPDYLADTLIPRYASLRSVVYSYKDGGAVGEFLPEWWRVTQALHPYLPRYGQGLDPRVVEVAKTTGADYFYFIHPDTAAREYLQGQDVVFENDYGVLIRLAP